MYHLPIRFIVLVVIFTFFIQGCCSAPKPSSYQFELSYDNAPSAYRNARSGQIPHSEALNIPIRIRNLSDEPIRLFDGPDSGNGCGLTVTAKLVLAEGEAHPYLSSSTGTIEYGTRAGRTMLERDQSDHRIWFDPHEDAVEDLADAGPPLLGLSSDQVATAFAAHANEAVIRVHFPVDWEKVPPAVDQLAVETRVALEITLGYMDANGIRYTFSETYQHAVRAYLINGSRGASSFRPGAQGPLEGRFEPDAP